MRRGNAPAFEIIFVDLFESCVSCSGSIAEFMYTLSRALLLTYVCIVHCRMHMYIITFCHGTFSAFGICLLRVFVFLMHECDLGELGELLSIELMIPVEIETLSLSSYFLPILFPFCRNPPFPP